MAHTADNELEPWEYKGKVSSSHGKQFVQMGDAVIDDVMGEGVVQSVNGDHIVVIAFSNSDNEHLVLPRSSKSVRARTQRPRAKVAPPKAKQSDLSHFLGTGAGTSKALPRATAPESTPMAPDRLTSCRALRSQSWLSSRNFAIWLA